MFKTLLTTCFAEFLAVFLPGVAAFVEPDSIEFPPQEIFSDFNNGKKHIVDLIIKVRFQSSDAFFLIHIENQSKPEPNFAFRMFQYAALLHFKYGLPIYPVVIFSHDAPLRPEPNRYTIALPGETILQFRYKVIQLNRMSWRKFLQTPNPAAAALMTKMKIAPKDRVKVAREILRMIATLRLDPARADLILGFMNTYLRLNTEEMKQ